MLVGCFIGSDTASGSGSVIEIYIYICFFFCRKAWEGLSRAQGLYPRYVTLREFHIARSIFITMAQLSRPVEHPRHAGCMIRRDPSSIALPPTSVGDIDLTFTSPRNSLFGKVHARSSALHCQPFPLDNHRHQTKIVVKKKALGKTSCKGTNHATCSQKKIVLSARNCYGERERVCVCPQIS